MVAKAVRLRLVQQNFSQNDWQIDNIGVIKINKMKTLKRKKDGSDMVKFDGKWYRPLNLEAVLNLQSAFYAGTAGDEIEQPIREWINFKGYAYVRA